MILKIIRFLYYALVLATPFVMYKETSEIFEFNKMITIYVITISILCLWIYHLFTDSKRQIRYHWFLIPFGVFFISQVISTILSIDIHTSLFGYYGRFNGGLVSIFCYLILLFILIQVAERTFIINLTIASVVAAVGTVLWGLPGRYGHDLSCLVFTGNFNNTCWTNQFKPAERMFSTLGQPNWLGAYLSVHIFIIAGLKSAYRQKITHPIGIAMLGGIFVLISGVLFTGSRSAYVSLGVAAVVFAVTYLITHRNALRSALVTPLSIGTVCVVAILIFGTGLSQIDRFIPWHATGTPATQQREEQMAPLNGASDNVLPGETVPPPTGTVTDSFAIRTIVWQGALELGMRYPLFGTGVETFAYAYYFVRPEAHNLTSEWDFIYNKAHNEYLNYLATTGFVGLTAYLVMIVIVLYIAVVKGLLGKPRKPGTEGYQNLQISIGLLSGYATILVTNAAGFSISIINILFYIIPAMIAVLLFSKSDYGSFSLAIPQNRLFRSAGAALSGLLLAGGLVYFSVYFIADTLYARGDALARAGEYKVAFDYFDRALQLRNEHVYDDKFSNVLANLAFVARYQDQDELSGRLTALSDFHHQRAVLASPYNLLYYRTGSKNSYLQYQTTLDPIHLEDAINTSDRAEEIAPTDPKIPYTKGLFYSVLYDETTDSQPLKTAYRDSALENVERALELKYDYKDAIMLYAQLLDKFEREDDATTYLDEVLESIYPDDGEITQLKQQIAE